MDESIPAYTGRLWGPGVDESVAWGAWRTDSPTAMTPRLPASAGAQVARC